jgi:hypothetical protein
MRIYIGHTSDLNGTKKDRDERSHGKLLYYYNINGHKIRTLLEKGPRHE